MKPFWKTAVAVAAGAAIATTSLLGFGAPKADPPSPALRLGSNVRIKVVGVNDYQMGGTIKHVTDEWVVIEWSGTAVRTTVSGKTDLWINRDHIQWVFEVPPTAEDDSVAPELRPDAKDDAVAPR